MHLLDAAYSKHATLAGLLDLPSRWVHCRIAFQFTYVDSTSTYHLLSHLPPIRIEEFYFQVSISDQTWAVPGAHDGNGLQ